ncbi:MAG TPA: hypothetical protein VGF66_01610 [Gaiellaceae bacterium]
MRINQLGAAAVAALALSASLATGANGGADPGTFAFHDCVGPAGTSSSFTATKENLPATAAHGASAGIAYQLADGSAVFVVQQFGGSTIAAGIPPRNLAVTCEVDLPSGSYSFTGALTPRAG